MLMNYVFTLDSVFLHIGLRTNNGSANQYVLLRNVLLSYVNEAVYLLENLPFFKIYVNCFMAQDNSPCASAISKCRLWVKDLVPLSE